MEKCTQFFNWLKMLPIYLRAVVLILVSALVLIVSMSFVACGQTRAVVKNSASGTTTEIKITTNNPTSVTASPNISFPKIE